MPSALVFFSDLSASVSKAQRELLTLAAQFENPIVVSATPISDEAQQIVGRHAIPAALYSQSDDASFIEHDLAVLDAALKQHPASVVLLGNDPVGRDIAARIAVRHEAALVTDVVGIDQQLVATKDELAGSYSARVASNTGRLVATIKPNSIPAVEVETPVQVSINEITPEKADAGSSVRVLSREAKTASERPSLTEASIVVAGGRGVDGDFSAVEDLADALGAAVGASRAATDAGWISHDAQIGQTGVTVSPQLYISAGISGAIQQKSGMQTSKFIIAVNKDMDAPVFEIADLGIVGDLAKVLPQAAAEIRRRRS